MVFSVAFAPDGKTLTSGGHDNTIRLWDVTTGTEIRVLKEKVRPHDLRARAITLVAAATQSIDATAEALGVDPQTARHYLDASKAFKGSELMKKFASVLLPQKPPFQSAE